MPRTLIHLRINGVEQEVAVRPYDVLLDVLAMECPGAEIETVESLSAPGELDPIQRHWATEGGSQCGFCTPGFLMTTKALLKENPDPSDDEIRQAISGNVCRCTGYIKILDAIREAAAEMRGAQPRRPATALESGRG